MNAHMHRNGDNMRQNPVRYPQHKDMGVNLFEHAVKIALDWTPDYIAWIFDDVEVRRIENIYFHRPLHLCLDRESFPNWFGLPETGGPRKNKLPNAFEVYYVRTWKRVPNNS